jgi:hypothetical protein
MRAAAPHYGITSRLAEAGIEDEGSLANAPSPKPVVRNEYNEHGSKSALIRFSRGATSARTA